MVQHVPAAVGDRHRTVGQLDDVLALNDAGVANEPAIIEIERAAFGAEPGRAAAATVDVERVAVAVAAFDDAVLEDQGGRSAFVDLLKNDARACGALDELDAAREWMLILGLKTAREKVSSLLVILAHHDAVQNGHSPADGWYGPDRRRYPSNRCSPNNQHAAPGR